MQSDEIARFLATNEQKVTQTIEDDYLCDEYERRREEEI